MASRRVAGRGGERLMFAARALPGSPLRVAFLSQNGDVTGGAEESLALLLGHLSAQIDPRVVLFSDGAYARRLRDLGFRVSVVPLAAAVLQTTRERFARTAFGALPEIGRLSRALVELGADVVHTNSVKAHILGGLAARMAGLSTVMHLRGILTGSARHALQLSARGCSRERIAISRTVADAYALDRTTVINNPLDLQLYRDLPPRDVARRALGLPETGAIVGLVGRINRWKGHLAFLDVAARLGGREDVTFAIFGEAHFRDADFVDLIQRRAGALGLHSRVRFVPSVNDARDVYAALDVNCICSAREPVGRSILEAAACGIPSVAFDDCGPAEIVPSSGGIVVPAGATVAFADAVAKLLAESGDRDARVRRRASAQAHGSAEHARAVADVLLRAAL